MWKRKQNIFLLSLAHLTFTKKQATVTTQKIITIPIGYVNSYLISNGENSALIDTGNKNRGDFILQRLKQHNVQPTDIKLIILTHTHFDHAGNAHYLKEKTGAQIVVHEAEKDDLARGFTPIPRGTLPFTKITSWLGRNVLSSVGKYEPAEADVVVREKLDLAPWKINGYLLHTHGHCKGSISFISGEKALVGDAFFNRFFNTHFPPFADDPAMLLNTWQKIFHTGVKKIYPGHGPKFRTKEAFPDFKKWSGRLKK